MKTSRVDGEQQRRGCVGEMTGQEPHLCDGESHQRRLDECEVQLVGLARHLRLINHWLAT